MLPCGILNITQILGVTLQHVKGYDELHAILKTALFRTKRIETNIRKLEHLHILDGLQSGIIQEAVEDFESVRDELLAVQQKFLNRVTVRTFLSAPGTAEKLSKIEAQLEKKDEALKFLGMIGTQSVEHRSNSAQIVSLLNQIMAKSSNRTVEAGVELVCQIKMAEGSAGEIIQRQNGHGFDVLKGFVDLTTGVAMYEGKFGLKNYETAAQSFNTAANHGWTAAYKYLGMLYLEGLGVERCSVTAKNFFQLGTDAGDPTAMTQLGNCYDLEIGAESRPLKAVQLVKRGADGGDPRGMEIYAWYKLYGHNTEVNLSLASSISRKAVKKGRAKDVLAHCYEQGIGVEHDPVEAVKLFSEVIKDSACWIEHLALARCYEQGIGVEADLRKAAELYRRGTEFVAWQRPFFQAYYGMCLIRGRGVCEDKKKGWEHIHKSIQGNNAMGWYVKGECYRFGYGVQSNLSIATNCYRHAIASENGIEGKVKASFALGCMYELGAGGLPLDLAAAFRHLNFAANRMHQEAQWKVAMWYESGKGVNRHEVRAVHYYRLAANSGHKKAQMKASTYYMNGTGVSRDLHTAVQLLRPAAENGDRDALRLLRRIERRVLARRLMPKRSRSLPPDLVWFAKGSLLS